MGLTLEQVGALAPDAAALAAGKKLAAPRSWDALGRSDAAVWGECKGSALYQVRVALDDLAAKCSCPSRKFPCKHALGLLFLAAESPDAIPAAAPPDWVSEWLGKRADSADRRSSAPSRPPTHGRPIPPSRRATPASGSPAWSPASTRWICG